jgi:NAD(P)-dependent dehydrogenase (short-subunit alcohol dehydrogenase family)
MGHPIQVTGVSILVTGATDGIGRATVERLVAAGADVRVHGRDPAKVAALGRPGFVADLASLDETRRLAREVGAVDLLVNNAGIGFGADRRRRELSRDGHELRLAVNYLAPFVLTRALRPASVVNVASAGQEPLDFDDLELERGYDGLTAYCRSKLALVMLTFDLADEGVAANALHPGTFLATNMVREAGIAPMGTAAEGADTVVALIQRTLGGVSGTYFDRTREAHALPQAYDREARRRLRDLTLALCRS